MWRAIWRSINEQFANHAVLYFTMLITSGGAVGGVYLFDPFYHAGWIISYRGWLTFFVVICAISIFASQAAVGLTLITVLAVVTTAAFGHLYKNEHYVDGDWLFFTWLLHLAMFASITGMLFGGGAHILERLIGTQGPRPHSVTKRKSGRSRGKT